MASDDIVGAASACQSGQAALAAGLLKRFTAGMATAGGNLVFSPLSIHVALALMSAGAAGKTLDQILAVAGAPSRGELEAFVRDTVVERTLADRSATGGPCVAFACGVWSDKRFTLKKSYRDTIVQIYKGDAWTVDFQNHVSSTCVACN
jgi:serpin B